MMFMYIYFFFFFSSRRRHTRCLSDWSSDVCSSDLPQRASRSENWTRVIGSTCSLRTSSWSMIKSVDFVLPVHKRSEERRVGKECRSWWWADHEKKNKKKE